ncbi:hypothetical protein VNO77_36624 [Canavalia gladiata]|uniref:Uncharacterized protein n=1 Tax=Canavalia gladiata TaxID=3824 RepID=A0AAN9K9G5_CANGL
MASSRRGYSKSQMCFFKILHIISSVPPSKEEANTKGLGIDLNLRFCSITESGESESSRENNNEGGEEEEGLREKSVEVSEKFVDHVESESEEDGDGNAKTASFHGQEGGSDSNCLDLLIEAVRVLSGKDECDSEEERELTQLRTRREKRKERWVVVDLCGDVVEEREPVVRSKRGRNQALPYRFRDSVVEPLKRSSRPQRPSSTARISKRLLRSSPTT